MELEVGFALEELAPIARLQHLAQSLDAIAAGEQQEPAKHLRGGRGDVGVVLIDADAEVRVVQRGVELEGALERVFDLLAVARRADPFPPQDPPLDAWRIRPRKIEPGFSALRLAPDPGIVGGDGRSREVRELPIEEPAFRVDLNLPPQRHEAKRLARALRGRWAGLHELGVGLLEARIEDRVVHGREPRSLRQRRARGVARRPAPGSAAAHGSQQSPVHAVSSRQSQSAVAQSQSAVGRPSRLRDCRLPTAD